MTVSLLSDEGAGRLETVVPPPAGGPVVRRARIRPLPLYLLRRARQMIISLWLLATVVFLMLKLVPGDPARVAAGEHATPQQVAQAAHRLGLDRPLPEQYWHYVGRLLRGDLGESTVTFRPVVSDLAHALPSTMELVIVAMIVNLVISIPLGTWAAVRHGHRIDNLVRVGALVVGGAATFWLALMAQYYLSLKAGLFPISGQQSLDFEIPPRTGMVTVDALLAGNVSAFTDALSYLALPAVVLSLHFAAQLTRAARTSMLSVMAQDFIQVARAKGATTTRVVLRHALPNALVPVISLAGLQVGAMISLVVLVEVVFARNGIGAYIANAVTSKDLAAVLGTVLFIGAVIAIVNLVADLLQLVLDPKVRHRVLRTGP
jgi:peptide/nickel transport system permease protein